MDEKAKVLIGDLMRISHQTGLTATEPAKESRFPCKRCGGSGVIFFHNESGIISGYRCPECRGARDLSRILKNSGITPENYGRYTLDAFKTDSLAAFKMKELALNFLKDPNAKGIGYFGRPGMGKTHICIAICHELHREHHYWQYRREIQRLKAVMYKDLDRYDEMIAQVAKMPWLYIDDLFKGAIKNGEMAEQDRQLMFDIINSRYVNRLPTIVSSEYPLGSILEADEAIGSRLAEMLKPYIFTTADAANRRLKA